MLSMRARTSERVLKAMVDRQCIFELLTNFSDAFGRADLESFANLWSGANCEWVISGVGSVHARGLFECVKLFVCLRAAVAYQSEQLRNVSFQMHGRFAEANWQTVTFSALTGQSDVIETHGLYEDRYVLVDGAWRLDKRFYVHRSSYVSRRACSLQ